MKDPAVTGRIWPETSVDIVTCEYPPSLGGVADYTYKVAEGLRGVGIGTHVWAPGHDQPAHRSTEQVSRALGLTGIRRLLRNDRLMGPPKGRRLLLQWEPVGYGLWSLNLPFCLWIASRVLRGTTLLVMFHETFLPLERASLKRWVAGSIQRFMAFILINSADAVFTSDGAGAKALRKFCIKRDKVQQLPVFSNIEANVDPQQAADTRGQLAPGNEVLVGHFGRYMEKVEPLVVPPLAELLKRNSRVRILFIGECGVRYRSALLNSVPEFESRIICSGVASSKEIGRLISACDFMFQPYPAGVTTRRSSTMAALANGKLVLTNYGKETEELWKDCAGVQALDVSNPASVAEQLEAFVEEPEIVRRACSAAADFYKENFSAERTITSIAAASRKR